MSEVCIYLYRLNCFSHSFSVNQKIWQIAQANACKYLEVIVFCCLAIKSHHALGDLNFFLLLIYLGFVILLHEELCVSTERLLLYFFFSKRRNGTVSHPM